MADSTAVAKPTATPYQLDIPQTTQACKVLLKHISDSTQNRHKDTTKQNLLAADDEDEEDDGDATPIWLIVTTKKHIVDQRKLKPSKILLPHPIPTSPTSSTICLITSDPSTPYTTLLTSPTFPTTLSTRITRTISLSNLKSKYTTFESRRKLFAEHDTFLADDRIVTYLPGILGKVFYKGGSKRPIPVSIAGERDRDEGGKRIKRDPADSLRAKENKEDHSRGVGMAAAVAKEIERALASALVHLAPGTSTAIKVGISNQPAEEVAANIDAVVNGLAERFISKGWRNIRAIHVKGPETLAFPVWLASELWVEDEDIKEVKPEFGAKKRAEKEKKKQKLLNGSVEAIEAAPVEGTKKRKADSTTKTDEDAALKHAKKKRKAEEKEKETAARKSRLKKQKEEILNEVS